MSIVANLTPFSEFNQSPRNMYQCQVCNIYLLEFVSLLADKVILVVNEKRDLFHKMLIIKFKIEFKIDSDLA